jgi:hypothetical protein
MRLAGRHPVREAHAPDQESNSCPAQRRGRRRHRRCSTTLGARSTSASRREASATLSGVTDDQDTPGTAVIRLAEADASAAVVVEDGAHFVQVVTAGGECSWECAPGVVLVTAGSYLACAVSGVEDVEFSTARATSEHGEAVSLWLSGPWQNPAQVTVGRFDGRDLVVDFAPDGGATSTVLSGSARSWAPEQSEIVVSVPDRDLAARVKTQLAS